MSDVSPLPSRETLTARLGREIRALMAREGINQVQMSHVLGIPQSSVSKRLRGGTPWDVTELDTVARRFRTSVAAIIADAERPRPGGDPDGDDGARLEGFEPPTF